MVYRLYSSDHPDFPLMCSSTRLRRARRTARRASRTIERERALRDARPLLPHRRVAAPPRRAAPSPRWLRVRRLRVRDQQQLAAHLPPRRHVEHARDADAVPGVHAHPVPVQRPDALRVPRQPPHVPAHVVARGARRESSTPRSSRPRRAAREDLETLASLRGVRKLKGRAIAHPVRFSAPLATFSLRRS